MLPKDIKYGTDARDRIMAGANKLANAVKATLGPRGRNVMIDKGRGVMPRVTKDGVTVAREIFLKDFFENMGAQALREVASKACDKAGDGTTTSTVLAQAIFTEGSKAVAAGMNPIDLKRGIDLAVDVVVKAIKAKSTSVTTKEEWAQVATLSANGDKEVGEQIAEALSKVGKEGVVTIEDNKKNADFELEVVNGMQFDKGFVSPYFANQADKPVCEFDDALILVFDKKLSHASPIAPLLEMAIQKGKPVLIVADEIQDEALVTLIVNKVQGGRQFCAVKAPGYGENKRLCCDDICAVTGATLITEEFGLTAQNATFDVFGRAGKVIVDKDKTTIVGGKGDKDKIEERCVRLRAQIADCDNPFQKEQWQERLAKMTGGIAVIRVGGMSEVELKERKDRVDDALHATRAAIEEGIVPGGGTALLYASKQLEGLKGDNDDQTVGINIIRKAIQVPLKTIIDNAGLHGASVADKLLANKDEDQGYDAQRLKYCDMLSCGIIDPAKVVRVALQDAASVAGMLITTEVVISEAEPEKDKDTRK